MRKRALKHGRAGKLCSSSCKLKAVPVILDWVVVGLAAAPIQETLHVTKYPSSVWLLVLMQAIMLLPAILMSIAMLFLHRAHQTARSLRLFVLAVAWTISALMTMCLPLIFFLLPNFDLRIFPWFPLGAAVLHQLLFIIFALDLLAFCRSSFYMEP